MSRAAINFTLGAGSGQGPAQSADANSTLIFYGTAPGTFATTATQPVFSLQDAITKGITNDYLDEVQPVAIITLTGSPIAGDTLDIKVTELLPNGVTQVIDLGTATAPATPTLTTYAAAVAAAINATTYLTGWQGMTGYTATSAIGVITIVGRFGLGVSLNSGTPIALTNTGTTVVAITQQFGTGTGGATAGVYSKKAIWYYHVSEFFRCAQLLGNAGAVLYVSFFASVSGTYADIATSQKASGGSPLRIGIYSFATKTAAQVVSDLDLMATQARALFAGYVPAAIFFAPNVKALTASALLNLQSATGQANGGDKDVWCIISQDGAAMGAQLCVNSGVSISNIGCMLGTSAAAAVSQNCGEVGVFNVSNGVEMNVPAFSTGELFSNLAESLINQLDSYRYGFCTTYPQYGGTYINNDWTSVTNVSNYNRLNRILTINKFERQTYLALLPLLKRRVYLNSNGAMDTNTINTYTGAVEPVIESFVNTGDLSPGNITGTAVTKGVITINPAQNVQTQGYVAITYNLIAVNIADNINVTLQYVQSV